MCRKFLDVVPARGDGHGARPDGTGTADVQRRVADDPDARVEHTAPRGGAPRPWPREPRRRGRGDGRRSRRKAKLSNSPKVAQASACAPARTLPVNRPTATSSRPLGK